MLAGLYQEEQPQQSAYLPAARNAPAIQRADRIWLQIVTGLIGRPNPPYPATEGLHNFILDLEAQLIDGKRKFMSCMLSRAERLPVFTVSCCY